MPEAFENICTLDVILRQIDQENKKSPNLYRFRLAVIGTHSFFISLSACIFSSSYNLQLLSHIKPLWLQLIEYVLDLISGYTVLGPEKEYTSNQKK